MHHTLRFASLAWPLTSESAAQAEELGLDVSEHGESMLVLQAPAGSKVHPFDASDADVAWRLQEGEG